MQDETLGVPVRTVKSFMSKIPSVFTGSDLIAWMMKNLDVDDQGMVPNLLYNELLKLIQISRRSTSLSSPNGFPWIFLPH
jgi:hypothetical protein